MPSLLLHMAAVERLAADGISLPPEIARAMEEDVEYARLGAALADLPECSGLRAGLGPLFPDQEPPKFARLFHGRAPVAMGLKMAELVANGALVGTEPGLAFVAGYFSHVCLDRRLNPLVERLVARHRRSGESERAARRRIDWTQALFYLRELHGKELLGTGALRGKFQVLKHPGLPTRGIGRGLYEIIRLSSQESLDVAPKKSEVDSWIRGLYFQAVLLASPLGRLRALPSYTSLAYRELYQAADFDVAAEVDGALATTRAVLDRLSSMIRRGAFSPRARARFLDEFPEGSIEATAA
ncbi:MAG: hypothetical protein ACYC8T_15300 [Myxococcaceae bacterium]